MLRKSKKQKPSNDIKISSEENAGTGAAPEPKEASDTQNAEQPESGAGSAGETEATLSSEEAAAQLKNQYLRLMADFDNYRKRQAREREEFMKRSNECLLGDLLPVVDHLKLALAEITDPEDPFSKGVKLVHDQFEGVLNRYGLTRIEATGEVFNPELHEALSYIPSPTVPANQVIDQFRCGWKLSGHLMRAAQVIVSSGQPGENDEQEGVSD
ncbi:MAG: nucleotide exchange factor GrpE [Kiritimatiellae bacterium]|nr:nucleotide exchange factor GrpE [Kiritimatiellia bacterium]